MKVDHARAFLLDLRAVKIEADSVLPFSRPVVYAAYRDELTKFVSYLPNVRSIEVKSSSTEGPITKLFNVWHGGGDIPAALRSVVGDKVLAWDDYATWNADDWSCNWDIKTHAFTEAVTCRGKNTFVELPGDRTRLEIHGDITIDVKKISGVPSFLAGSIGKSVESFLVKQITANLSSVSEGRSRYLADRKS